MNKQSMSYVPSSKSHIVVGQKAIVSAIPLVTPKFHNKVKSALIHTGVVELYNSVTKVFETKDTVFRPVLN